jgi:dienelactone hydrolase
MCRSLNRETTARMRIVIVFLLMLGLTPVAAEAVAPFQAVTLPTEVPTGDPAVDAIQVDYYAAKPAAGATVAPAVVVLPPIGSSARDPLMQQLAQFAMAHGVSAAVMTLPYHGLRWPSAAKGHPDPALYFLTGDAEKSTRAFAQSASDVTTTVTWLLAQPGVDRSKIGVVGISLGAIVAHLAMGRDDRIKVGVAMLGGGNLVDLSRHSFSARLMRLFHPAQSIPRSLSAAEIERLQKRVDPITYADENRPRHVFMVQGARDAVIPPRDATALWNALGRPPIRWLDTNHFALRFVPHAAFVASLQYFEAVWAASTPEAATAVQAPQLSAPTIKLGFVAQTHQANGLGITPALTYQFLSFGTTSRHLSIAHLDFGITGRGPFAGAAVTLGPCLDLGFASRLVRTPDTPRPYIGVHITF